MVCTYHTLCIPTDRLYEDGTIATQSTTTCPVTDVLSQKPHEANVQLQNSLIMDSFLGGLKRLIYLTIS